MSKATARRTLAPTTEWIPLNLLSVDPAVQRPRDEVRVSKMAADFRRDLLGIPVVSSRKDGTLHIIDGQHRCAAARLAGFNNDLIECKVIEGLTLAEEAAMFNGLNTFKAPHLFDRFVVRKVEGDPIVLGVDQILMEFGWYLSRGNADGAFAAVDKAEKVYTGHGSTIKEAGPENLRAVMGVITEAWGRKPSNVNGSIVAGLGLFFARYGADIDRSALVKRLAKYPGGADNYLGKARGIREFRGGTLPRCVAELTTDLYNRKRSTSRLETWR